MIKIYSMNINNLFFKCIGLLLFLVAISPVWAGGPLIVNGGNPVVWPEEQNPIVYTLDQGRLGPFSNTQAARIVRNAFRQWQQVENCVLEFEQSSSLLPNDITGSNFSDLEDGILSGNDVLNPIIFDDDGSIIELVFGGEDAKDHLLGFASPYTRNGRSEIAAVVVVFNGYFLEQYNWGEEDFLPTVLHELGHFAGLDHSQHARHLATNRYSGDDRYVSIMYPMSTEYNYTRSALSFDDKLSITNLYPNAYHRFSMGNIEGTVTRDGQNMPGVNVIARKVDNPLEIEVSTVTGTYRTGSGEYELNGLPPGNYELMVEAIDEQFTDSSSVGQYANSSNSRSFRNPVRAEYYNEGDQNQEGRSVSSLVTVRQSNTTTGIDVAVESASMPADEDEIFLLAIGSQMIGAVPSSRRSVTTYLLHPSGDEGHIDIHVEFESTISYQITVRGEDINGENIVETVSGRGSEETVTIGPSGIMPLEQTRYFIIVSNISSTSNAIPFTISTEISNPPTPTPSHTATSAPTPTRTSTPTRIPRPTYTEVPTNTETPTNTPTSEPTSTPRPTATPTPIQLLGDANRDDKIDHLDLFSFSMDWQKRRWQRTFESDLIRDGSLEINLLDLLTFIESFHNFKLEEMETGDSNAAAKKETQSLHDNR